ncbi:MAG: hypothetical protein IJ506_03030 [Clostridia bacterium]|nr:hypothetical protein [Clostridia bacterium]
MNYKQLQKLNEIIETLKAHPNSDENIQFVLELADNSVQTETLKTLIEEGKLVPTSKAQEQLKAEQSVPDDKKQGIIVDFTKQEIQKMPNNFKKVYKKEGRNIYAHAHKSGKATFTWEIRYRRNGYDISVCGKTIEIVKKKFLEKLEVNPLPKNGVLNYIPITFHSFSTYYFENYRIKKVCSETYKKDLIRYKKYLEPYFKETPLVKITLAQCQKRIDDIIEQGKGKTADEIFFLMNGIFRYAKDNHIIQNSPSDAVFRVQHEKASGTALTKEEEKKLLFSVKNSRFEICFAIALYTGLRPNEYQSIEIDRNKGFIIAKNSKQKKKRNDETVYKKIPITPMLRPYIEANPQPYMYTPKHLRKILNMILPNHILYDLRTTFYSRCKECGVEEPAYKSFMGHSLKSVDKAYTDLSDEYLIAQGNKIVY